MLGGLAWPTFICHSPRGWESKIKMPTCSLHPRPLLVAASIALSAHVTLSLCAQGEEESKLSGVSPSQGPTLVTSYNPDHLQKALPPNTIPLGVRNVWGRQRFRP